MAIKMKMFVTLYVAMNIMQVFNGVLAAPQQGSTNPSFSTQPYGGGLANGLIGGLRNGPVDGSANGQANKLPNGWVGGLPNGSVGGLPNGSVGGSANGPANKLPNGWVGGLPNGSVGGLPNGSVGGLPNGPANKLPNGWVGGLPNGSANKLPNGWVDGLPNGSVDGSANGPIGGSAGIPGANGQQSSSPWEMIDQSRQQFKDTLMSTGISRVMDVIDTASLATKFADNRMVDFTDLVHSTFAMADGLARRKAQFVGKMIEMGGGGIGGLISGAQSISGAGAGAVQGVYDGAVGTTANVVRAGGRVAALPLRMTKGMTGIFGGERNQPTNNARNNAGRSFLPSF